MKKTWLMLTVAGVLAAATTGLIKAQNKSADKVQEKARPADEAAIIDVSRGLARAMEKGDAKAVAGFFTEEGEYQDEDGEPIRGRAALAKAYGDFFAKRTDVKVEGKIHRIRFLGKDTAIEEGTIIVHAKDQPANSSRYSSLYARQDGAWLIALLKEWGDDSTQRAKLNDLAWLIGTWESGGAAGKARTKYEWVENKKFIKCQYTVELVDKDKKPFKSSGTQVIGVDPANGQIRSWTFDSEGGIGEATWSWDEGRWAIDSGGTLADGSETTALNLLTRAGDDAFTWRSVKRTMSGEALPDLPAVKVTRIKGAK